MLSEEYFRELQLTEKMILRATIVAAALALGTQGAAAQNGISGKTGSEKISIGTLSIVASPVVSVAGGSNNNDGGPVVGSIAMATGSVLIVSGIVQSAVEVVELLLTSASTGAKFSVKISGKTVDAIGVSVGTTVSVVSEASGTLLVASGKVLAFIPNALGEALLSQKRLPAP